MSLKKTVVSENVFLLTDKLSQKPEVNPTQGDVGDEPRFVFNKLGRQKGAVKPKLYNSVAIDPATFARTATVAVKDRDTKKFSQHTVMHIMNDYMYQGIGIPLINAYINTEPAGIANKAHRTKMAMFILSVLKVVRTSARVEKPPTLPKCEEVCKWLEVGQGTLRQNVRAIMPDVRHHYDTLATYHLFHRTMHDKGGMFFAMGCVTSAFSLWSLLACRREWTQHEYDLFLTACDLKEVRTTRRAKSDPVKVLDDFCFQFCQTSMIQYHIREQTQRDVQLFLDLARYLQKDQLIRQLEGLLQELDNIKNKADTKSSLKRTRIHLDAYDAAKEMWGVNKNIPPSVCLPAADVIEDFKKYLTKEWVENVEEPPTPALMFGDDVFEVEDIFGSAPATPTEPQKDPSLTTPLVVPKPVVALPSGGINATPSRRKAPLLLRKKTFKTPAKEVQVTEPPPQPAPATEKGEEEAATMPPPPVPQKEEDIVELSVIEEAAENAADLEQVKEPELAPSETAKIDLEEGEDAGTTEAAATAAVADEGARVPNINNTSIFGTPSKTTDDRAPMPVYVSMPPVLASPIQTSPPTAEEERKKSPEQRAIPSTPIADVSVSRVQPKSKPSPHSAPQPVGTVMVVPPPDPFTKAQDIMSRSAVVDSKEEFIRVVTSTGSGGVAGEMVARSSPSETVLAPRKSRLGTGPQSPLPSIAEALEEAGKTSGTSPSKLASENPILEDEPLDLNPQPAPAPVSGSGEGTAQPPPKPAPRSPAVPLSFDFSDIADLDESKFAELSSVLFTRSPKEYGSPFKLSDEPSTILEGNKTYQTFDYNDPAAMEQIQENPNISRIVTLEEIQKELQEASIERRAIEALFSGLEGWERDSLQALRYPLRLRPVAGEGAITTKHKVLEHLAHELSNGNYVTFKTGFLYPHKLRLGMQSELVTNVSATVAAVITSQYNPKTNVYTPAVSFCRPNVVDSTTFYGTVGYAEVLAGDVMQSEMAVLGYSVTTKDRQKLCLDFYTLMGSKTGQSIMKHTNKVPLGWIDKKKNKMMDYPMRFPGKTNTNYCKILPTATYCWCSDKPETLYVFRTGKTGSTVETRELPADCKCVHVSASFIMAGLCETSNASIIYWPTDSDPGSVGRVLPVEDGHTSGPLNLSIDDWYEDIVVFTVSNQTLSIVYLADPREERAVPMQRLMSGNYQDVAGVTVVPVDEIRKVVVSTETKTEAGSDRVYCKLCVSDTLSPVPLVSANVEMDSLFKGSCYYSDGIKRQIMPPYVGCERRVHTSTGFNCAIVCIGSLLKHPGGYGTAVQVNMFSNASYLDTCLHMHTIPVFYPNPAHVVSVKSKLTGPLWCELPKKQGAVLVEPSSAPGYATNKGNPLTGIIPDVSGARDTVFGGLRFNVEGLPSHSKLETMVCHPVLDTLASVKQSHVYDGTPCGCFIGMTDVDASMVMRDSIDSAMTGVASREKPIKSGDVVFAMTAERTDQRMGGVMVDDSKWGKGVVASDDFEHCNAILFVSFGASSHVKQGQDQADNGARVLGVAIKPIEIGQQIVFYWKNVEIWNESPFLLSLS